MSGASAFHKALQAMKVAVRLKYAKDSECGEELLNRCFFDMCVARKYENRAVLLHILKQPHGQALFCVT